MKNEGVDHAIGDSDSADFYRPREDEDTEDIYSRFRRRKRDMDSEVPEIDYSENYSSESDYSENYSSEPDYSENSSREPDYRREGERREYEDTKDKDSQDLETDYGYRVEGEHVENEDTKGIDPEDEKYSSLPKQIRRLFCYYIMTSSPNKYSTEALIFKWDDPNIWQARRLVVDSLGLNLQDELDLVGQLAKDDDRNYLNWHHRRWISEKIGTDAAAKELKFTDNILSLDAKNNFAWAHRQFVLEVLGQGWEDELAYCTNFLEKDSYNKFAWNQRYFVVKKSPIHGGLEAMIYGEVDYALQVIDAKPANGSAWTYLKRLLKDTQYPVHNRLAEDTLFSLFTTVRRVNALKEEGQDGCCADAYPSKTVVGALEIFLDLLNHGYQPGKALIDVADSIIFPRSSSNAGEVDKVEMILQWMDEVWMGF